MSLLSFRSAGIVISLSAVLFRLSAKLRPFLLLACSLLFYAVSPELLVLHAAHTALTMALWYLMRRFEAARRPLLALGILANCLALFWLRGRSGFSYAVLMHIGFLLDVSHTGKTGGAAESAAALTFFPCLQEGPILDVFQFRDRLLRLAPPSWERGSRAALRIVTGLIKKLVVADRLAAFVNGAYSSPQDYGTAILWLAMLVYAVQVYMDFSGCMDIVLGVSSFMGIDLPENFRRPYLADSCTEYWHRWHITMGAWFKHRVFYPLAASVPILKLAGRLSGNPRNPFSASMAAAVPMLLTWALVGLWHGFELHYVLWGIANGLLILTEGALLSGNPRWPKTARIVRTFFMMCLIRVLFRADNIRVAAQFYLRLFRFDRGPLLPAAPGPGLLVAALFALAFFLREIRAERDGQQEFPVRSALVLSVLGVTAVLIFGCYGPGYSPAEFFYNRF